MNQAAPQPDYASYSAEQLQQALRSIDRMRFPQRVLQIEAALANLANLAALPATPPPPLADPASYRPILARSGWIMLAAGALVLLADVATASLRAATPGGASINFNLTALVLGVLLLRGGLRTAMVLRWLSWLSLPGCVLAVMGALAQPAGLTLLQIRLYPVTFLWTLALPVLSLALCWWLQKQLGRAPIRAARLAEGRKDYPMRLPFALGALVSLAAGVMFWMLLHGESATRAERVAAQQTGPGYRYQISQLRINNTSSGTYVSGTVLAWNQQQILGVPFSWKE